MNRKDFTSILLAYGSASPFIVTLFFIFTKGIHEGNILPYIVTMFIPGCISLYISAHILFNNIANRYRNNENNWVSALYLVLVAYALFGFLSTVANGFYEPYKVFRDLGSYFIMSAVMGGIGFVATCWLSIPLGFYVINKYLRSNKQLNLDSGADASPPVK